jgi:cell shape-determining protein MreC
MPKINQAQLNEEIAVWKKEVEALKNENMRLVQELMMQKEKVKTIYQLLQQMQ